MKLPTFRNTPAIIIATGALLLSATGGAVAAGMITGADIKNGTVTTKDIKNETIKLADISSGAESALQGATGPAGPAGPAGTDGPAGPAGPAGVSGWQRLQVTGASIGAGATGSVTLACPAGKRIMGASADWTNAYDPLGVRMFDTEAHAWGWNAAGGAVDSIVLYIICANVT